MPCTGIWPPRARAGDRRGRRREIGRRRSIAGLAVVRPMIGTPARHNPRANVLADHGRCDVARTTFQVDDLLTPGEVAAMFRVDA